MQGRLNLRRASLVDALDTVSMDASAREIAKAQIEPGLRFLNVRDCHSNRRSPGRM